MARSRHNRRFAVYRRGAAVVEAVLLSTFLLVLLVVTIDIGQYLNTVQVVRNASREATRFACRNETDSVSDIQAAARNYLHSVFSSCSAATLDSATVIEVLDSSGAPASDETWQEIESGEKISVQLTFQFEAVRWLPVFSVCNLQQAEVICFGRRE
ncbi:MAG: TadE/TadG family type IV pilus assembly protein [Pirellulaceae bacterium]